MISGEAALDLEHPSPLPRPLARVYGEPVNEFPHDLYIPPEALEIFLETFEGPLDLLLYLIRRQNINVLDIPMAELTRQYLGYVEMMRRTQLELAAEYLLMAAVLIEIKSRLLLPRPPAPPGDESADPRAELVRRLLEYERMKQASRELDALTLVERDFATVCIFLERVAPTRFPNVAPDDLRSAWAALIERARVNRHHLVSREQLSVRSEMSRRSYWAKDATTWAIISPEGVEVSTFTSSTTIAQPSRSARAINAANAATSTPICSTLSSHSSRCLNFRVSN